MTDYSMRMPFNKNDMGQGWEATAFLSADVDGDGYDELVQTWGNSGKLGMIVYSLKGAGTPTDNEVLFSQTFMLEGSGAVAWLAGDIDGDGRDEVLQIWDKDSGTTGATIFQWTRALGDAQGHIEKRGTTAFLPDGAGGSWLIADINGDGRDELIQMTGSSGQIKINVYGWTGETLALLFFNRSLPAGAGAMRFLVGDVNGDGRPEVIQLWSYNGTLAMIVYGWVSTASGPGDMKILGGSANGFEGAVVETWAMTIQGNNNQVRNPAWLVGDIDHDGRAEIVQPWSNGGKLAMTVYGWDHDQKSMVFRWHNVDMTPPGGIAERAESSSFLIGDINLDGYAEIIRMWNNNNQMAISVFGWSGGGLQRLYLSAATGQGPNGIHFMCEKFRSPGRPNILQLWQHGDRLGMLQYGQDSIQKDGSFAPQFLVLSVRYAPPGNKDSVNASQVSYLKGTSSSTMHSVSQGNGETRAIAVNLNFAGSSLDRSYSSSNSTTKTNAFSLQRSQTMTVAFGNPAIDGIDHNYDVFHLWLNPLIDATDTDNVQLINALRCREVQIGTTLISDKGMYVAEIAAGYLNGRFSSPPPQVAQLLSYLGPSACDQILSTNPMLTKRLPASQQPRYLRLPVAFWYASGLTPVTQKFSISTSTLETARNEATTSVSQSTGYGVGVAASGGPLSGGGSQSFSKMMTWTSTSVTERSVGSTELAEFTIVSPSASYTGDGQLVVYWDQVYSTFMFDIA